MNIRKLVPALACLTVALASCSADDGMPNPETRTAATITESAPPTMRYIAALIGEDIPITNQERAVKAGRVICSLLAQGHSYEVVSANAISQWRGTNGATPEQSQFVVDQAIVYLCPEYSDQLPKR